MQHASLTSAVPLAHRSDRPSAQTQDPFPQDTSWQKSCAPNRRTVLKAGARAVPTILFAAATLPDAASRPHPNISNAASQRAPVSSTALRPAGSPPFADQYCGTAMVMSTNDGNSPCVEDRAYVGRSDPRHDIRARPEPRRARHTSDADAFDPGPSRQKASSQAVRVREIPPLSRYPGITSPHVKSLVQTNRAQIRRSTARVRSDRAHERLLTWGG